MVRNYALTKTDTHLHSLMVTMSQKSSDPQAVKSVSQVLMPDTGRTGGKYIWLVLYNKTPRHWNGASHLPVNCRVSRWVHVGGR
jgi:hypothetical protein